MKVAIIGAGAAGCFCAVNLKRMMPSIDITIYERSSRPMAKLAITGGGRCNLTNTFRDVSDLNQVYPRGGRLMQRLFHRFSPEDTRRWWEEMGVELTTQPDQCIFPRSQNAMQIVNVLLQGIRTSGIHLRTNQRVLSITPHYPTYDIITNEGKEDYNAIVVTTGGSPRFSGLNFLSELQLPIVSPVPSLFALNINDQAIRDLTGIVIEDCRISIAGTNFQAQSTILLTHFGISGPAVLRLSSYAARYLAEHDYHATVTINWMHGENENKVRECLQSYQGTDKNISNYYPTHLTSRHWKMILKRASIDESHRWNTLNRKELNRLVNTLTADSYQTDGRCTYKAEFVTSGGVSLQAINPKTLASKSHPGVYFAGEVLDVDAVTGGFNLQAAWTMGYVVAENIIIEHRVVH